MTFNRDKYKQILYYFIRETSGVKFSNVGRTVLHKLLYFNEFDYYERYETPLTDETFIKQTHGPFSTHFDALTEEMIREEVITCDTVNYKGKTQYRYRALKNIEVDLPQREMENLEDTLRRYGTMTGSQIEAISHQDMPWIAAEDCQKLDYEFVFYRSKGMAVTECSDDDS